MYGVYGDGGGGGGVDVWWLALLSGPDFCAKFHLDLTTIVFSGFIYGSVVGCDGSCGGNGGGDSDGNDGGGVDIRW